MPVRLNFFQKLTTCLGGAALAFVFFAGPSHADDELPFNISCDYLKYSRNSEIVFSSGNVFIERDTMKLYADEAEFRRNESLVFLKGRVRIEDADTTIRCDAAEYHLAAGTEPASGLFQNARVYRDKMYFVSLNAEQRGDSYIFNKAYLTTCDEAEPHYKMSSPRIVFVEKKSVTMKHAVFSIRGVPVFYTPYYRQRLGERRWTLAVRAGKSSRNGAFIKTRLRYNWSDNFRTYFINDYFSRLGYGKGLELDYKSPSTQSNLYVYGIDEKDTGASNRTFRQSHWQQLPAGFLWQSYVEAQDYSLFNDSYLRDDSLVLKPTYVRSRASLSKSVSTYYLRLSGYRNEVWRDSLDRFDANNVIAPELYFRLNPVKLRHLSYDLSYNYRNYFNTDPAVGTIFPECTPIHSSYARIFNSYRLMKSLTLFPRIGYQFYKSGNLDSVEYYFHDINTTLNFYRPLKLSFTHNYKRGPGKNSVADNIAFADEYRPSRNLVFRQSVVYDLKKKHLPLENRFSLLQNQLNLRAGRINFYARNYYDIAMGAAAAWEGEGRGSYFSSRFTYNRAEPDFLNWFQSFNFKYGKWDTSAGARAFFNYRQAGIGLKDVIEKHLTVKRNLHCWEMMFKYLVTRDRREGWIFFNITAFPERPMGIYRDAVGDEWSFRKQ
ncbi:MAG: hypothetical protein COS41_04445 [Elusimicrobia bacterium CG03_land_8_20_14_0_80_50_18]|nr:MAG: hypothetical protein COS41_04445 [Elusimicrobia bacterium CG03_land_8_20_14_0_80_50_18]